MRRNTPLRVKQLCQIRLLHSPLLCHVREGCGLSLSTEASVCTVETGPRQVMCAALIHVTVTYKILHGALISLPREQVLHVEAYAAEM